ncbi:hypothetical protein DEH69_09595 [Streptomyces sp. PT12]|nr:hypothetical protein DEH69_09595 [Streptomyces sp. PT12]
MFRQRMRRPVLGGLAVLVGVSAPAVFEGEPHWGLAIGGLIAAVLLFFGLLGSLSFLVRSGMRIGADGLFVRYRGNTLTVPWQDVTYITFARAGRGGTLVVTAVLRDGAATRIPAALRRSRYRPAVTPS